MQEDDAVSELVLKLGIAMDEAGTPRTQSPSKFENPTDASIATSVAQSPLDASVISPTNVSMTNGNGVNPRTGANMYERGIARRKLREDDQKALAQSLTPSFHPIIKRSKQAPTNVSSKDRQKDRFEELYERGKASRQSLDDKRTEASMSPAPSTIITKVATDRLLERMESNIHHSQKRLEELKKSENDKISRQCTFAPRLPKPSRSLSVNTFLERTQIKAKERESHIEELRVEIEKKESMVVTGRPVIPKFQAKKKDDADVFTRLTRSRSVEPSRARERNEDQATPKKSPAKPSTSDRRTRAATTPKTPAGEDLKLIAMRINEI